jgi:hypothetical protein
VGIHRLGPWESNTTFHTAHLMPADIYNALGNVPKGLSDKVNEYFDSQSSPVKETLLSVNDLLGLSYRLVIDWRKTVIPLESLFKDSFHNVQNQSARHHHIV